LNIKKNTAKWFKRQQTFRDTLRSCQKKSRMQVEIAQLVGINVSSLYSPIINAAILYFL